MPFPRFTLQGVSRPLRLEPGHAEAIGATPYVEPGAVPFAEQKIGALRAEIRLRNESRSDADKISAASRHKASLVAALEADDAAQAVQDAD